MKTFKRPSLVFVCALLISIALIVSACEKFFGKKPFHNLKPENIVSATVLLQPPDKTFQITEIDKLTDYLNDVVIYHKDQSYSEYCGQAVIFTLSMADGTKTKIMCYNPFLVIDNVGYQTKYGPCETLSSFANELLDQQ